ncbi:MAG: preprotein translocase subunit YajC [Thermoanaerobaculia bacterium]|nr:preprotein translocase subunit YajC [Thermoanaerobaculia bacterium]
MQTLLISQLPNVWIQVAQAQTQSPLVSLVPIFLVFGIFYFLLLAPMRKRQKALQKVVEGLKRGDKVVTNGGLIGEIAAVEDRVVHLKLGENVKVRVLKSAIAGLEGSAEPEATK